MVSGNYYKFCCCIERTKAEEANEPSSGSSGIAAGVTAGLVIAVIAVVVIVVIRSATVCICIFDMIFNY